MRILNYTGKYITVINEFGLIVTYPPEANAYCDVQIKKKTTVDMMTVYRKEYGRVINLPRPDPNFEKLYIVNKDVAVAAQPRFDLLVSEIPQTDERVSYHRLVNV